VRGAQLPAGAGSSSPGAHDRVRYRAGGGSDNRVVARNITFEQSTHHTMPNRCGTAPRHYPRAGEVQEERPGRGSRRQTVHSNSKASVWTPVAAPDVFCPTGVSRYGATGVDSLVSCLCSPSDSSEMV
jgi:hypothetical protein